MQGMKCEQYWPREETSIQYGDIIVTSREIYVYAEYIQRKFMVSLVRFK